MNSLKDYFHTDWSAMTQHDWLGLLMTIVVFFVMIGLYVYVFHPANKKRFEDQRFIPLNDEDDLHEKTSKHFPRHAETEEQK